MHKRGRKGFTLVELSLSIAFIAVLSLAVVLIITNSISAYHRGLILNQINTTGMELVDDMRASIQNAEVAPVESKCELLYSNVAASSRKDMIEQCKGNGVVVTEEAKVTIGESNENNRPVFGAFCTGNYSYIWNSGYFFADDATVEDGVETATLKYRYLDGDDKITDTVDSIRLLKVKDEDRAICASHVAGKNENVFDISGGGYRVSSEKAIELLSENSNLALYDLSSAKEPTINASQNDMYYSASFVIGTLQGGADVKASGNYCVAPDGGDQAIENFDYCAINKFNFAARSAGGGE